MAVYAALPSREGWATYSRDRRPTTAVRLVARGHDNARIRYRPNLRDDAHFACLFPPSALCVFHEIRLLATPSSLLHFLSGCQYSVYPADWKPDTTYRPATKAAKEYPFTLDPFQKQAIQYIERNESVLVSAHTSAGKVGDVYVFILEKTRRMSCVGPTRHVSFNKNVLRPDIDDVRIDVFCLLVLSLAVCSLPSCMRHVPQNGWEG